MRRSDGGVSKVVRRNDEIEGEKVGELRVEKSQEVRVVRVSGD